MTTGGIIAMVAIYLAVDAIVIVAVFRIVLEVLAPLVKACPPIEPKPDAVRKNFQSFSFGMANFGGCVHVLVDDGHLHLRPAMLARWFALKPMSIRWDQITWLGPARLGKYRKGGSSKVKVENIEIRGPGWCLDLAKPVEGEPAPGEAGG